MPIQHAIWQVGNTPAPLKVRTLANEKLLEDMIAHDSRILSSEWLLIGRQERTSEAGILDLLAIAPDGSLVVIELKRDRTPREVVAQALDYAEWVSHLTGERLVQIYARFSNGGKLNEAFQAKFGTPLDEDSLNQSHQIVIVAAELDPSSERIVSYLNARNIAINVMFFQVFEHGGEQLLSRAWLIDPVETQVNVERSSVGESKEPWNGEFYASYGDRDWESARKFGFISGGGGAWYSQTLKLLQPNDRVWVKIPGTGYVGVARVLEPVVSDENFYVSTEQGTQQIFKVINNPERYLKLSQDPERAEYFVRVKWLDTRLEANAINEVGMFGNQNTVCRPTSKKWRQTVERLKTYFKHSDLE